MIIKNCKQNMKKVKEFDYKGWIDELRVEIGKSWDNSKNRAKRRTFRKTKLVRLGINYLNVLRYIAKLQKTTMAKVLERFLSNSTMYAINRKEYLSYQQKAKAEAEKINKVL